MDPALAATKVTPRTRAIIPVHLYGLPARMDEICAIAKRHSLLLLEDCAQAHGALYRGRQVGTFGHAASYSFFPGKNLGAWGDAGAMVTNDEALARTARMLSQHGQAAGRHDHQIEGRNSRMDGLHAAVLSAKLPHLKDWNAARRRIGAHYRVALRDVVSGMQDRPDDAESAYHLFVIEVQHRDRVKAAIAERGISTAIHYPRPLPLLPAYSRLRHRAEDFPEASDIATRILSIPLYPEASDIQQREVIDAVISAVASASAGRNN
jgi:dTDP-4-amino-4,6-dideoxygalactose transaminase